MGYSTCRCTFRWRFAFYGCSFCAGRKKRHFFVIYGRNQFQYAVHAHRRLFHPKPDSKSGSGDERGSMAVPEQFRLWYHAGDFLPLSLLFGLTTWIKSGSHRYHPSFGGYASDGPTLKLLYTFFVFIWSFMGYYYSPLHLCQLLTVKYMGCAIWPVYKEHLKIHSLAVCILLLTILSVSVDSAVKTPSKRRHKILF